MVSKTNQPLWRANHSNMPTVCFLLFTGRSLLLKRKASVVSRGPIAQYGYCAFFFYPDYTVDPGISPDHALTRSWVITTDRELEPAFRTLPRRFVLR
jgi:hypothetical protein